MSTKPTAENVEALLALYGLRRHPSHTLQERTFNGLEAIQQWKLQRLSDGAWCVGTWSFENNANGLSLEYFIDSMYLLMLDNTPHGWYFVEDHRAPGMGVKP